MADPNVSIPGTPDPAALAAFAADQTRGVNTGPDQNPFASQGVAQGSLLDATPGPVTLPGSPVVVPAPAAAPTMTQEDPLERAHRLAATDSSQLTQADYSLLAAEDLAMQNAAAAGRGGPTHSVKVGESNSTTASRTKVRAEAKAADAAVAGSYDQQKQAVIDTAAAKQQQFIEEGKLLEQQNSQLAAENAKNAEAEGQRAERMAKLEADQSQLAQDVAKEARAIDPDRWLHQSAGRTIGAALAAALGAYGAALGKTPNYALEIINGAIDRDFQGQKIKLQAKQDQQSMQGRVIDRTRALFTDQRAGDLAARANLMELHKAQVLTLAKQHQGTIVEKNAMESAALIEQEQQKFRSQAAHLEDAKISTTSAQTLATVDGSGNAVGSGSGKGVLPLTAYNVNQRATELATKNNTSKFSGSEDSANSQRRTREVLDRFAAFTTLAFTTLPKLEKAIKDRELVGAGPFSIQNGLGTAHQDATQLFNTVKVQAVKAFSGAQSSAPEQERIASTYIPDDKASAERQVRALRTSTAINAATLRDAYESLTPDGKEQVLRAAGGNKARLDAMLSGRPGNDWLGSGTEMGATPHTGE